MYVCISSVGTTAITTHYASIWYAGIVCSFLRASLPVPSSETAGTAVHAVLLGLALQGSALLDVCVIPLIRVVAAAVVVVVVVAAAAAVVVVVVVVAAAAAVVVVVVVAAAAVGVVVVVAALTVVI